MSTQWESAPTDVSVPDPAAGLMEEMIPWDAELFMRFREERARPAADLIARIDSNPRRISDLGCGVGVSTGQLAVRFPGAEIIGVDASTRMLAVARQRHPAIEFRKLDIADWRPEPPPDLIFADNTLQWVADHQRQFPRLMEYLAPGGVLAVQMPDNRHEPSHALMRLIAADQPWADRLVPIAKTREVIASHTDYYNWLRPLSSSLDIWQTTYVHPLAGVEAVVEWFRGSALLPFLAPLTPGERDMFLARYRADLAEAYPVESDGRLLFLYPRLFILAHKPG